MAACIVPRPATPGPPPRRKRLPRAFFLTERGRYAVPLARLRRSADRLNSAI